MNMAMDMPHKKETESLSFISDVVADTAKILDQKDMLTWSHFFTPTPVILTQ